MVGRPEGSSKLLLLLPYFFFFLLEMFSFWAALKKNKKIVSLSDQC
jgi:hypothetical protein